MSDFLSIEFLKSQALAYNSEPYWFGLGFIQLKLSDTDRMHFWLPQIPRPEREEIHNHRYDFRSTVLAGELCHDVYNLKGRVASALRQFCDWEIFDTDCAPGKEGVVERVTSCDISRVGSFRLSAGSVYEFPHTSYHTTGDTFFAVTHLVRQPKKLEYASVIRPKGARSVCPFKDKIETSKCWGYIEAALRRAKQEAPPEAIPCDGCGKPSGSFGIPRHMTRYLCLDCGLD